MSETTRRRLPVPKRKVTAFLAYPLLILLIILLIPASAYAAPHNPVFGPETLFNGGRTTDVSAARLTNNKFVVAYRDVSQSNAGTAIIGEVVGGGDVAYGPEKVFNTQYTDHIFVSALSESKFVIVYADNGSQDIGTAVIGTVSGNNITLGTEKVFNQAATRYLSVAAMSADKFVITYRDSGNSASGTAILGSVSGTTISFGAEVLFSTSDTDWNSVAALSADRFVVVFQDLAGMNHGRAALGSVSGNTIAFTTGATFNTPMTTRISTSALTSSKFVVTYLDGGSSDTGVAVIGDVSETAITFGAPYVFNGDKTYYNSVAALSPTRFLAAYEDNGTGMLHAGTATIGDVDGNSIAFSAENVFNNVDTDFISAIRLSPAKFAIAYHDNTGKVGRVILGYPGGVIVGSPSVQTNDATDVTSSGATLNGNITDTGGENCNMRGFQYRVQGTETWTDLNESGSFGAGSYSLGVSGLTPLTTYEFKATASNSDSSAEGDVLEFNTSNLKAAPEPIGPTPGPTKAGPVWYLAEGSTAWGFSDYVTIENPNPEVCTARVTYMTATGPASPPNVTLPAMSQTTVNPRNFLGAQDFSTKVECLEGKDIAVDRTMTWTGPGAPSEEGHNSIGVTSPNTVWYLPEGSSAWGFECWLLIQNPNATEATCNVTYMMEGSGAHMVTKKVPANSRRTYNIADDIGNHDVSIKVESNIPVIPERAMYRNNRREGHDSIGTYLTARDYYLAEGTTAWGFTTYVLIQNPNLVAANVTVTYMTPDGTQSMPTFKMEPTIRKTIRVNDVLPNTDVSTLVQADQPIIAERAMYWGAGTPLGEACHDSIGMEAAHMSFYLPDGETSNGRETWTLVQNPNKEQVEIRVSYLVSDGKTNATFTDTLKGNSRKTYNMADHGIKGRAAVMVTSLTPDKKIMVERAMYWNSRGAGTDTIGGYSD